ncbi:MAG: NAD-dependent deacylase [Myxococcales bacterium]|nr:NAD-dependent deacylase [Myxococcales bacterium]
MSVDALAALLSGAERVVALTGAGVSTESGIPDFRSHASGLWQEHDPMRVASIDGFLDDPSAFYAFWGDRFGELAEKRPNATHALLAALEAEGRIDAVITQNIDGLHHAAGSRTVLEVHGSYRRARCLGCGIARSLDEVVATVRGGREPRCECRSLIKPDVVLFGEMLPPVFGEAERRARACDLMLVLGSSLEVYPVAGLVPLAAESGAKVAIVNRDAGPYDHLAAVAVHAELGETMRALADRLALTLP